jgi:hypothetical protein
MSQRREHDDSDFGNEPQQREPEFEHQDKQRAHEDT